MYELITEKKSTKKKKEIETSLLGQLHSFNGVSFRPHIIHLFKAKSSWLSYLAVAMFVAAMDCAPMDIVCGRGEGVKEEDVRIGGDTGKDGILPPAVTASTRQQWASIAELPQHKKYAQYERVTLDHKVPYFNISCRPITKVAEDDMELVSDILTWGELYLHNWEHGVYSCARCKNPLYHSDSKWKGPCVWPSFRAPINETHAISSTEVYPYNNYTVVVKEVYCGKCDLFLGHQFEDGIAKGDRHPEAHWRH
jgi:peptide-methionine (R)-S-oxide reductase